MKSRRTSRREFLKYGTAGVLGLSLRNLPFNKALTLKGVTELLVYIGTYTNGKSKGIYLYRLNLTTGDFNFSGTTTPATNPSFLSLSPDERFLYTVNEVDEFAGAKSGAISAYAVNQDTGALHLLNQQPSLGASPCYVEIDAEARFVLTANYGGGNVSVFPVQRNGSLGTATDMHQYRGSGPNRERQQGPHAHCIVLDRTNQFAYSCDLGTDRINIFRFDNRQGKLLPAEPAFVELNAGDGPRHFAIHPTGAYAFVINELHSTVTTFARDQKQGSLRRLSTVSTLPADFTGANTGADIHVSADGRFVYGSNRGHDSIGIFRFDPKTGLTAAGHESTRGRTPRNFGIDPSGRFLLVANQNSDNVVVFRRDEATGRLSLVTQVEVPSPVCVKFKSRTP